MAENVKVIVRCRPMSKKDHDLGCQCIVKMNNCSVETWDLEEGPTLPKRFTFDSVYDQAAETESIYNDICYPLVESVLEGYNATIFVYGQTGCGKSHTMEGQRSNRSDRGVISRAFDHIFEAISVTQNVKYLVLLSYLEIYNETIRDLLVTNSNSNSGLALKESPGGGVSVPALTSHPVHDVAECEHLLELGAKNRIIGATLMNQNSSRSHSILTISLEQMNNTQNNNETIRKGKLNLVDLAGSERQTKTGATGDRLKEATKINLSLSALGNVISALVDGKAKHIPYRDSKLTRLLQDSLGGNTRTLMIACISPSSRDYAETLSTLRYANRAKNIHNKPIINEDPKDTILRQYQEEINKLKTLLTANQQSTSPGAPVVPDSRENAQLRDEMERLKNLHENEKSEKENVLKEMASIRQEYESNASKNQSKQLCTDEEIMARIETLKKALIGGEKVDDKEISERRKRKKMAAEQRASVIAHLLAKIDMNEDRELLQNQYKDISQELSSKSDLLRRYRHRVKTLEKEIQDIQSEFETERQDYLETIRKQDRNVKLLEQIAEKMASTFKRGCNYGNLEIIREQSVWLEDVQKYKLPDIIMPRTKLPPPSDLKRNQNVQQSRRPGRIADIQTAPARLQESLDDDSPSEVDSLQKKLNGDSSKDDIISNYFEPTTKRVAELLNQSAKLTTSRAFNAWRGSVRVSDYAIRRRPSQERDHQSLVRKLSSSHDNLLMTEEKKPTRLAALPNIIGRTEYQTNESAKKLYAFDIL